MTKRLLLALALVIGLTLPAHAAITRGVGPTYFTLYNLTSDSTVITGTTAGRSLIFVLFWYDPDNIINITSITISGESNATLIAGSKFTSIATDVSGQIAYLANNVNGGDKTITVTADTQTYVDVMIIEYAGLDLASQPDNSTSATGNPGPATVNLTTTTAGALIVAGGVNDTTDLTEGSDYTLLNMPNIVFYEETEDNLNAGAAGVKTVNFTGSVSSWGITAASFKAVASAATPVRHGVINQ